MAIETGIAPQHLLELDADMINAMMAYFKDRAKRIENGSKARGGSRS
jgi:hypothetical protein